MNIDKTKKATVFDIQPFSIHDGPGVRTTVFLKGCPLRCAWCHNPESNAVKPEVFYFKNKCQGCQKCIELCPQKACVFSECDKCIKTDRDKCIACGECLSACLYDAKKVMGTKMSVSEVMNEISKDALFFAGSGGGVTLSGGEPLMQPDFSAELLKMCKENGYHTAMETCGYASEDAVRKVVPYADLLLYDIKAMDDEVHKKCTGVSNERILKNIQMIRNDLKKDVVVRIPVVPDYNMYDENMEMTGRFILEHLDKDVPVHLLAYHNLGESKKENLERTDACMIRVPTGDEMEHCKEIFEKMGLDVQIGGGM